VDIGQRADSTAIIVTEEQHRDGSDHYVTRLIERLTLGTKYPVVADRIVQVVRNLEARSQAREWIDGDFPIECWLDATGVGLPVLDLIREQGVSAKAAIFTGSDKLVEHPDDVVSVGKSWMVGRLQVLLQAGRLHLPISAEAAVLIRELQEYQIDVNERAHASFNAPSGKHDDLVIALGLSVGAGKRYHGPASVTSWMASDYDDDDYRHPDHVPPWFAGNRLR
jgi:hypothetical protein